MLIRFRKYLTVDKAQILGGALIDCHFICAFTGCVVEKSHAQKQKKIRYRVLKLIIYQSNNSYEILLERSNKIAIHRRQFWFLLTKIFKSISRKCFCDLISLIKEAI